MSTTKYNSSPNPISPSFPRSVPLFYRSSTYALGAFLSETLHLLFFRLEFTPRFAGTSDFRSLISDLSVRSLPTLPRYPPHYFLLFTLHFLLFTGSCLRLLLLLLYPLIRLRDAVDELHRLDLLTSSYYLIILRVHTNPKPEKSTFCFNGQSTMAFTYSHRPVGRHLLKMKRRMEGILFEEIKVFICQVLNIFRELLQTIPERRAGKMFHNSLALPLLKSAIALSETALSLPAFTSSSNCLSQSAASNSSNQARNSAISLSVRPDTAFLISCTGDIAISLSLCFITGHATELAAVI